MTKIGKVGLSTEREQVCDWIQGINDMARSLEDQRYGLSHLKHPCAGIPFNQRGEYDNSFTLKQIETS